MENNKIEVAGTISVGITHVSGKLLFKNHNKKHARVFYSVCNFSQTVYAIFPEDYLDPTMVTTTRVSPVLGYCDRSAVCLDFKCDLNRFNKEEYIKQFSGMGGFTLGLPISFGEASLWFNEGKWRGIWGKFVISPEGGTLKYNKNA